MNTNTNKRLILLGTALLVCLPLFTIVAGAFAYLLPREYCSTTSVEIRAGSREPFLQAFQEAAQPHLRAAKVRQVRNTQLWEIGVYDANPQQAAALANSITAAVQQKLMSEHPPGAPANLPPTPVLKIWQRAEPATKPAKPSAPAIMFFGIATGMLAAFLGAILLGIGLATKSSYTQNPPKLA